jgi:RNA polymerase sigma-70 factor (ECF subfamily)
MADSLPEVDAWLSAARAGSPEALAQALEAYRGYLLLIAQDKLAADLRPKMAASDLVQETLEEARGAFDQFHGSSGDELRRWLHRILLENLISLARRYRGPAKRQLGREVTLSADELLALTADSPTPSTEAMNQERARRIQEALGRLPEEYRRVIELRYQDGRTFEEIGSQLGLSANAARHLWRRAVKRLQEEVAEPL